MITVNTKTYSDYPLDKKLSLWLREDLMLTGTKVGCDIGVCGSCTVLIGGEPRKACRTYLKDIEGKEVITIEGLAAPDGTLHPIQQAFIDVGAIQCGFCTPGMVLTAYAFLQKTPHPTRQQARQAIRGNLCRCTGYQQIIDAVMLAAGKMDPCI
jgi:aerobic-type carbon monoxide dehydrogenase small subunit (CoxS/CutS family)